MAIGLKSLVLVSREILLVERFYYLCSENKSADQLRGYCAADLHLCSHIYVKSRFSHDAAYMKHSHFILLILRESTVSSANTY